MKLNYNECVVIWCDTVQYSYKYWQLVFPSAFFTDSARNINLHYVHEIKIKALRIQYTHTAIDHNKNRMMNNLSISNRDYNSRFKTWMWWQVKLNVKNLHLMIIMLSRSFFTLNLPSLDMVVGLEDLLPFLRLTILLKMKSTSIDQMTYVLQLQAGNARAAMNSRYFYLVIQWLIDLPYTTVVHPGQVNGLLALTYCTVLLSSKCLSLTSWLGSATGRVSKLTVVWPRTTVLWFGVQS